jgi:hypothetical protein
MNLQEDIQRIKEVMNINESSSEKLIKYVYDNGSISTAKLVGGYDDLLKLLGEYSIPREFLIRDIEEFLDTIGGYFALNEYGETGIPYKEVKDEYHEIAYLGYKSVVIDVWNGFDFQTQKDEYLVNYNELPYKSLQDIVKMISELDPDNFN